MLKLLANAVPKQIPVKRTAMTREKYPTHFVGKY